MAQLWAFWVAPTVGGALAGVVYPLMAKASEPRVAGAAASR